MTKRIIFSAAALALPLLLLLCAPARAELAINDAPDHVTVAAPGYSFDFNLKDGTWNALWPDGKPFITRAFALWEVQAAAAKAMSIASGGDKQRSHKISPFKEATGSGQALDVWFDGAAPRGRYSYTFRFYDDLPYFTVLCSIRNDEKSDLKVSEFTPLKVDSARGGAVFAGPGPSSQWILENGYNYYFDFFPRLIQASESANSNWNYALYDPATSRAAVFGFITVDHGMVSVLSHYDEKDSLTDAASGWRGLSGLRTVVSYTPSKPVAPNAVWTSETLLVMPDMKSPHRALETFAAAAAARYPMRAWTGPIPTGWNVWATKIHHELTQENMSANARWVRDNMLKYGMTVFQIDDGWQKEQGDWFPTNHFYNGMKWTANNLKQMGLKPGIWVMPFCVSKNSQLAKDHPDWLAPKNSFARNTMPKDWEILDLSHPQVKQWLHDTFYRISHEWGYKVIKIDFIYYALLAEKYYDPKVTNLEAYREAHRIIREAIGDDAFLIDVSVPIYGGLGYADGMRLGLDNTPAWGDDEGPYSQGLKPMVRDVARRYYLNYHTWVNHPDMFYLGSPEEKERWGSQLTLEEARTYATLVALEGGITKIGDTFTGLNNDQAKLLSRLLPVYKGSARPIDLFKMAYPQIWDLRVDTAALSQHVVGVFNWGRNREWGKATEEGVDTVTVRGVDLGLDPDADYIAWGFWGAKFLGEFSGAGQIDITLPPRTVEALVIQKKQDAPQYLSTNRHVTQGGTDIQATKWDPDTKTLSVTQRMDADFDYEVYLYAPDGYTALEGHVDQLTFTPAQNGNVVRLTARSAAAGTVTWTVRFIKW